MGHANIFPRWLFGAIRREKPDAEASKRLVEASTLDAEGACRLLGTSTNGLSANDAGQQRS